MDVFQSIVLGIIQGITEFIPISSSGHLDLIPRLLNWENPSTVFILFLHLGTLLALLYYYRKLIAKYLKVVFKFLRRNQKLKVKEKKDLDAMKNVLIAVMPALFIGIIFEKVISGFYDNTEDIKTIGLVILIPLILIGIIFLFEDRIFKKNKLQIDELRGYKALIVGLAQAMAFIRGVSRSGITLLAGQVVGLKRVSAAEFSFLMSIPVLTATSIYSIFKLLKLQSNEIQNELGLALVGAFAAFVSGLIAVKFLLRFLQSNSLKIFGIYRIVFGVIILLIILV